MKDQPVPERFSLWDLAGLISLGAFSFWMPVFVSDYSGAYAGIARLAFPLVAVALVTQMRHFKSSQIGSAFIWSVVLVGYFSLTAAGAFYEGTRNPIRGYALYTAIAFCLSLVVTQRAQILAVLGGLVISAPCLAYLNHGEAQASAASMSQAAQSGASYQSVTRLAGTFGNANETGMFAVVLIVAAAALYFGTGRLSLLPVSGFSSLCAAYVAMHTGSRKAILGIGILACFALWIALRQRKVMGSLTVVVALISAAGAAVWMYNNPFLARFNAQDTSYLERSGLLRAAWDTWLQNPVFGVGFAAFVRVSGAFGLYSHSTPLEMLANGGLVAFGIYLAFWWRSLQSLRASLAACRDPKEKLLLQWIGCYFTAFLLFSFTSVTHDRPLYLVLNGCICGYLRSREVQARGAASLPAGWWPGWAQTAASVNTGSKPATRRRGWLPCFRPEKSASRPSVQAGPPAVAVVPGKRGPQSRRFFRPTRRASFRTNM